MNLPNKLTVMRIILVPFFMAALLVPFPHHYLAALALFAVASYTDHLDGKIARRDNLVTNFGKFLDPLADKVLVVSALVCFVEFGLTPAWMVMLIIAREFLVTSLRLVAVDNGVVVAANQWGKIKTVSQVIAILAILCMEYVRELGGLGLLTFSEPMGTAFFYLRWALLWICTFFTVLSGIIYLKENWGVVASANR